MAEVGLALFVRVALRSGQAALAGFERQLIHERTPAGLRAARARGRVGGRPKALAPGKRQRAVQLYQAKRLTVKKICEIIGISKPTLYAYVRQAQSPHRWMTYDADPVQVILEVTSSGARHGTRICNRTALMLKIML
jgi:Helix-turn-helix domain of resolvase